MTLAFCARNWWENHRKTSWEHAKISIICGSAGIAAVMASIQATGHGYE